MIITYYGVVSHDIPETVSSGMFCSVCCDLR